MIFKTTVTPEGTRLCFVDGYPVPEEVYESLFPEFIFGPPRDPNLMPREEAERVFKEIKAATPPKPQHKGPYFNLAIDGAHPLKSDALAVHPKQIAAVKERNRKRGLNIDYDRHGRPVFTDAGQRRKLMKIEGVRQQNSYFGY